MKKSMSLIMLIFLISIIYISCENNKSVAQDVKAKTEDSKWVSFDEGLKLAEKIKKPVLIDFYTDWCHWCKVMDEKTFSNEEINKKLKEKFITIRLNAESTTETGTFNGKTLTNKELTREFRITGFPSLAFLSKEKEIITVIPGYVPADKFTHILDYISNECYKTTKYEDYLKDKEKCNKNK